MKGAKVVWKINIQSKERQKTSRSVRIQTRLGLRKENAVGIKKEEIKGVEIESED